MVLPDSYQIDSGRNPMVGVSVPEMGTLAEGDIDIILSTYYPWGGLLK